MNDTDAGSNSKASSDNIFMGYDAGGGTWATASGTWGAGTLTPTCGVTYTFPIDSGDEFVLTTDDPGWPLVRQPYYKPQVIMS